MHINILKASKRLIKLLSAFSNNNSPHKLENKFCMRADDQKLRYDLEWTNVRMPNPGGIIIFNNINTVHLVVGMLAPKPSAQQSRD